MKKFKMACAVLLACALPTCGQLLLNPGEVWSYEFQSLPRTGSVPAFGGNPYGSLAFLVNSSSFQSGDLLRYELFENSLSEAPLCSGTMSSVPPFDATCRGDFAWQDGQGAVRLTMLSGSATVDSITLKAVVAGPSLSSYDVYSTTFVPVPEPSIWSLSAALGCAGVALKAAKRRK